MISIVFDIPTTSAFQVSGPVPLSPTEAVGIVLGGGFRLPSIMTAPINCNASPTLGGGFRLPGTKAAPIGVTSPLTIGGGFRMPANRMAPVTDRPSINVGGGFRMTKTK
jgi:hypothetical protein